jgi:protein-S-isoprenylcysteine O-methyltransferase Ste14
MSGAFLFAALCYFVAVAGCAAFAVFVLMQGQGLWPAALFAVASPWLVNGVWLLLFAAQHSGMARESFKRGWTRVVPRHLERSVYAAVSGLLLLALPLVWQPLPGAPLWEAPRALAAVPLAAGLGLALVNLRYDHLALFGLRQAMAGDSPEPQEQLVVSGPYRFVRHPLMTCLIVFLWAQPVMLPGLALLAAGLTGYILLGTALEERDLLRRFGPAYAAYRRAVPRLVPWRRPAPPEGRA